MENKREVKIIAIVALLVAVVGLSVAYAALSTSLSISGTATVNSATWQVKFVEGSWTNTGDASATGPTFGVTSLTNIAVTLVKPGDKAVYNFQVTNSGSIPAKLSENTVINKTLTCTGGASDDENTTTCGNIVYTLTYKDGSEIRAGDTLANGTTKDLTLTVEFKSTAAEVPSQAVTVNGISATLEYVQA